MREKHRERVREGGKHGSQKNNSNPEVVGYRNNIQRTTSFFITNFPEETTTSELWSLFNRYWKVGEVYIPNKLDKAGKRFGFARFEDVVDRQKLLQRLEDTSIGTYKIRANLPKFGKGMIRLAEEEYRAGIMAIDVEPDNLKNLEGSFVGTLRRIADADNIQVTMWMEGFQQIKARPLGLDLILLTSPNKEDIQKAYESNKSWWERWFSNLTPWRPNILPKKRRVLTMGDAAMVESFDDTEGIDHGVINKGVSEQQEDRQIQKQKAKEQVQTKGVVAVDIGFDGDVGSRLDTDCGREVEIVMETPDTRVVVAVLGSQEIVIAEEVGDKACDVGLRRMGQLGIVK
ncbi:RNA recognition motif [Trifolium medium]|uniref:RNA recognition motif n=1 Tax=Trifolium medium TaxID=97028 RepID=A0A392M831_9FABA|nr:RNA recognition motif [Trifolium medium]